MAINSTDTTWGWYGQSHGVSVFFADKYHFIHENHELRFNADNIPHFQIRVSHTRQLGSPYSSCIPSSREASHWYGLIKKPDFLGQESLVIPSHWDLFEPDNSERQATEDEIKENCFCEYGLLHKHQQNKQEVAYPSCNFTQRVRCVNKYVIDYITDDHALSHCLPECNRIEWGIFMWIITWCRITDAVYFS